MKKKPLKQKKKKDTEQIIFQIKFLKQEIKKK